MNSKIHRRLELLDSKARKVRIRGLRGGATSAEINITPLVDVVLVLLIIFMVVLKKIVETVELPTAFDPQVVANIENPLNVFITIDGSVMIDEDKVAQDMVTQTLKEAMLKNPLRKVLLSADKNLKFKNIRSMLESLRDAGVATTDLMSNPIKELEK